MNSFLRSLALGLLFVALALHGGDLRVNLINGTRGGPGVADHVAIVDLSMGMMELTGVDNVNGNTTLSGISADAQKQYLVRATHEGATYTEMFVPDPSLMAWEINVTVYETESEIHDVVASVPYFVIYAFEDHIYIQKRYILENHSEPPVTFYKSPGIASVYIPDNFQEIDYLTFKQGTMPLKTQPIATDDGQVLPHALKPGASEIDIAYTIPYDPKGTSVTEIVGYDVGHFHVYTMPMDLNISAIGLSREGTDQENGLAIFAMENVQAGAVLSFSVSGTGMKEGEEQAQQTQSSGKIVIEHRLPMSNKLVIAGVLALLIVIALFFSITQQQSDLKAESVEMLKEQKRNLLKKYAALDAKDSSDPRVEQVLRQLISVYKTLERIR